jgi:hypothetical protein
LYPAVLLIYFISAAVIFNYATWNIRGLGEKEEELDKILNGNNIKISVIIIIILIIIIIIPETNHVSRVCIVAAVLYLQFVLHIMLLLPLNVFCTCTFSLSVVCVQCPVWLFFVIP